MAPDIMTLMPGATVRFGTLEFTTTPEGEPTLMLDLLVQLKAASVPRDQLAEENPTLARVTAPDALARARQVNDDIAQEGEPTLTPTRASQSVTAAALLLKSIPVPSNPEAREKLSIVDQLLTQAAVRQAESSAARRQARPLAPVGIETRDPAAHIEQRSAPEHNIYIKY